MSNKPAFPQPDFVTDGSTEIQGDSGMDLRDYFAAKAMEGMLLKHVITEINSRQKIAAAAYRMADSMLEARDATQ
jgi:hypothetical protein